MERETDGEEEKGSLNKSLQLEKIAPKWFLFCRSVCTSHGTMKKIQTCYHQNLMKVMDRNLMSQFS